MSAPWSVEFNEDVLGLVVSDIGEVAASENLDGGLVPVLGQVLGEQVLLELAFDVFADKVLNVFS